MLATVDHQSPATFGHAVRRVLTLLALLLFVAVALVVTVVWTVVLPFRLVLRVPFGRLDRVIGVAAAYLAAECGGLVMALVLSVRARLGRWDQDRVQRETYRLLGRLLRMLRSACERFAGLEVEPQGPADGEPARDSLPTGPLVIASRHGGPGGAFLLAEILINNYSRRPRVVLRATLRLDPLVDVLLSRVPTRFINPQPGDSGATAAMIGGLASGMGADDVLLIFPEGGSVTAHRRQRALARLRRRQSPEHVRRAEKLRHTLPPHPDGLFAALDAAPDAGVLFVAHTGLDHGGTVAEAWHAVPLTEPVRFTSWESPAEQIPADAEARLRWLERNWAEMDRWVGREQGADGATAVA